ncbi:unnamed protein product, partial [Brassica rapa subsp. narinosa]
MEEIRAAKYPDVKDDHSKATDEKMMSIYLQSINDNGESWPEEFMEDRDVFTKNPSEVFEAENPFVVFVYPRTEACGRTDGCGCGGWRIIGHDKLIKDEDTGKILGFKKILKFRLANQQDDGAYYLQVIFDSGGNEWPCYVANDVYCVHPSTLVDHEDKRSTASGLCIFANRTEACGYTDGCESGRWRIVEEDNAIFSMSHEVMGYKRVFKFYEEDKGRYFDIVDGEQVLRTWIMEEYRLVEDAMKDKVLCVIKRGRRSHIDNDISSSSSNLILSNQNNHGVHSHNRLHSFVPFKISRVTQPASSQRYVLKHHSFLKIHEICKKN